MWITTFSDSGLNGYATFPWDYADAPKIDGIVISKYTLPMDKTNTNYQALRSVGITLTHETGHWLGLFHTFQVSIGGQFGRPVGRRFHSLVRRKLSWQEVFMCGSGVPIRRPGSRLSMLHQCGWKPQLLMEGAVHILT